MRHQALFSSKDKSKKKQMTSAAILLCALCPNIANGILSYYVAVIQWIKSCHKNRMATRVITLWRIHATSWTTSVSTMRFLIKIMFSLKAIKFHFKRSYDEQNITLL